MYNTSEKNAQGRTCEKLDCHSILFSSQSFDVYIHLYISRWDKRDRKNNDSFSLLQGKKRKAIYAMADNESMTAPGENSAFTQSQQSIPESSETSGGATQLTESQSLTASSAISHDSTQLPKSESVPTASSGNSGSTTLPRSQSLTALTTTTKIAGNPTRSQPASNSGDASLPRSVLLTATAQIAGNPTPLPQAQSIPPSSSENSGNSTRSQSASIPTAISENAGGVQPSVTVNTTPSGGDQSSPTRDGHQVETPLLQQLRTRDER